MLKGEDRSSGKLKDLAGKLHEDDAIANMDTIVNASSDKYNTIILTNKPFEGHVLASMRFAEIHCIDVSSGVPMIDFERFEKLSKQEKLKDLDGLLKSISGMLQSIQKFNIGLSNFASVLVNIEDSLKK